MKSLIFTGTRAEFGLLTPLARALEASGGEVAWLASGMHLLPEYGETIKLVRQDSARIAEEVDYFCKSDLSENFGAAIGKYAEVLRRESPDWAVVLGDRHETLAFTMAAAFCEIPIAHLHGGDKADSGHMDEAQRHAITRFAALHLAASNGSAERLRKFGEEDWRIHMVGAPGIDRIRAINDAHQQEIIDWGEARKNHFLLTVFHPLSLEADQAGQQAEAIFSALDQSELDKLVIYPNNDPGGEAVMKVIKSREGREDYDLVANLEAFDYVAALANAEVFVGNSSSGVIEAPYFGLPMVHTGKRNFGREHAGHVEYVEFEPDEILAAINQAYSERVAGKESFSGRYYDASQNNPYGDGHAAERSAKLMHELAGDPRLLRKLITY